MLRIKRILQSTRFWDGRIEKKPVSIMISRQSVALKQVFRCKRSIVVPPVAGRFLFYIVYVLSLCGAG